MSPRLLRPLFTVLVLLCFNFAQPVCAQIAAPKSVLLLHGDVYPRVFFFRQSEGLAAGGRFTFEEWDENFNRLMGIMGKTLDEEVPGRSGNIEFFTRFKNEHPDQAVLLHFNGNARDPRWEAQRFFSGHWLYYNGAKILSAMNNGEKESTICVSDASLFETGMGRYGNANEDIGLCLLDADGRPNWNESEQVQLLSVDREKNSIRVRRGCYGTTPRAFPAGKAYAAAHCSEGPWGKDSNILWLYNYATTCPKDAQGHSCSEVQATHLNGLFGAGGPLARFDGLEFDVLFNSPATHEKRREADCDADGRADGGVVDGVNVYGAGVIEYCRLLRAKLGESRIIMADGAFKGNSAQRAFGILNGIESEGWPFLLDKEIRDWSGGLNRHFFWNQNARPPVFNYINHKYVIPGVKPGEEKQPAVPFNIHRLVFAAGVFTDSAICYSFAPPGGDRRSFPIWDEFVMGVENRLGWLGKPVGPAVRLAKSEPDLLHGEGNPVGEKLLHRLESDEAQMELDHGAVKLTGKNPSAEQFRVKLKNVPCAGPDLFVSVTARGAGLRNQPSEMARLMYVGVDSGGNRLVRESPLLTGMARRGGKETPIESDSGAGVRYEEAMNLGGETRAAYFVHPPYTNGAKGYTFWQSRITVPEHGLLEFETGIGVNGATKGDGVTFIVQVAPECDGQPGEFKEVFRAHEKTSRWTAHTVDLAPWAGRGLLVKFVSDCGPGDNTVADHSYWGNVRVVTAGEKRGVETPAAQFMTWLNAKDFTSGFYFNDVRSKQVDLEFVFESSEPVWISALSVHAYPDAVFREFEHGLVVANPSPRPCTFELSQLFPGKQFRRIKATVQQDTQANNGERVGGRLTLGPREGLFLVEDQGDILSANVN